jgi:uncharacterized membrane protein
MCAFALFFGLTVFGNGSLRLDEAQSLFQVNRDIPGMLHLIGQDVHVPLYHTLLHFWLLIWGQDVLTARILSLLFFIGTILMTYVVATYAFSRRSVGLFATLLVTISPFMNWYGTEIRMYTMLTFITMLHTYLFLKLFREGGLRHWIVWTIVAIAGVYTHYFFLFVLVAECVALLLLRKQFAPKFPVRKAMIAGAVAIASLLPWGIFVLSLGSASNTQPALMQPTASDLFDTYAQFLFGFQTPVVNTIIVSLWPIAVLLGFFALQRGRQKVPAETMLFVVLATLPILLAFVISITIRPFYLSRYLIVSLPALLIFIAWLLTRFRRSVALLVGALLVVVVGFLFIVQVVSPNTPVKEDYRESVAYLEENADATDVIILAAPFTIYPVEYYYDGEAKLTTQPIWDRFSSGSVPGYDEALVAEQTQTNTMSYRYAWLVLSYDQGYNEKLKSHYDDSFEKVSEQKFSPGLVVYQYKLRYDEPLRIDE